LVISGAAPVQAQIAGRIGRQSANRADGPVRADGSGATPQRIVVDARRVRPMFQQDNSAARQTTPPGMAGDHSRKNSMIIVRSAKSRCCSSSRFEAFARDKQHVSSEMQFLAGLQRIDYVFVYPTEKTSSCGPAEGYVIDSAGRAIGKLDRAPALRLDDLMWRLRRSSRGGAIAARRPIEAKSGQAGGVCRQKQRAGHFGRGQTPIRPDGHVLACRTSASASRRIASPSSWSTRYSHEAVSVGSTSAGKVSQSFVDVGRGTAWSAGGSRPLRRSPEGRRFWFEISGQRVQLLSARRTGLDKGRPRAPLRASRRRNSRSNSPIGTPKLEAAPFSPSCKAC